MRRPLLKSAVAVLAAAVAGALVPLAHAPYNLLLPSALGLALFAGLIGSAPKVGAVLRLAFGFGLGLFLVGASWVYHSIHIYGEAPAPLALLLTGSFVAFLALFFCLPWAILRPAIGRNKGSAAIFAFAAIWVASEALRGWIFTGFPWLFLGHAHTDSLLTGWLPIGGSMAASFVQALVCAAVGMGLANRSVRSVAPALVAGLSLLILALPLQRIEWTVPLPERTAVLVQPDISLQDKWNPAMREQNQEKLFELSEPWWGADILIWPEGALPISQDANFAAVNRLHTLGVESGTAVFTGRLAFDPVLRRYTNNLLGTGLASGQYAKRRLVPFGEYVPFEEYLRGLFRFFDLPMSTISPGDADQSILRADNLSVAVAICYEIAYGRSTARDARNANLIVTVSNDTWFGDSIGPHQHLQIARARAIETAKPVLRGTNDGISAIVDHRGRVIASAPSFVATTVEGAFQPTVGSTPYSRFGDLPILIFSLLALIGASLVPKPRGW